MGKYDEELFEDIKACVIDKKNPKKCIDLAMDEHEVPEKDREKILASILKEELE